MKYLNSIILLACVFIQPLYSAVSPSARPVVSGKESVINKQGVSKEFDFTQAGVRVRLSRKNSKLVVDFPYGDHDRFSEGSFRYQGKGINAKKFSSLVKTADGFASSRTILASVCKWHLVLKKKPTPMIKENRARQTKEETITFSGGFLSFGGGVN